MSTAQDTIVAVIGLGVMGAPMARNLLRSGFDVVGVNRSPGKVEALRQDGGRGAGSVAEAAEEADVVITVLPDSPDVEDVALGQAGILANARRGCLWVDCSTIRPDVAVRLSDAAREAGVHALDAPVSGGERGAVEGTLSVMVGGEADVVATARPVLEAMGRTIVHVGPAGAGQTVKAANQLVVAGHLQLLAEALVFLEAHGVDPAAALDVLAGGLAGSKVLEQKRENMLTRSFEPGFRLDLHHKDMGIVTAAAREAGVVVPLGALSAQLVAAARAQGDGALDHSALLRGVLRLSGRDVGEPGPR